MLLEVVGEHGSLCSVPKTADAAAHAAAQTQQLNVRVRARQSSLASKRGYRPLLGKKIGES